MSSKPRRQPNPCQTRPREHPPGTEDPQWTPSWPRPSPDSQTPDSTLNRPDTPTTLSPGGADISRSLSRTFLRPRTGADHLWRRSILR
jgi:hypothetical protein